MKESLLWKRIDNRFRERIKNRINSESGSALVMAVYFMFAVVAVTSVVAAVLVSLVAPLRNNTKRSEAAYAAEAGLQAGLTYLRQLESDSSAPLFPAAAPAGEKYYKDQAVTAAGSTIDVVKVKTSQPQYTANANTVSYTDNFSYETEIAFFKNDPNGTDALEVATERKDAKYAVVVARAYDGNRNSATRAMSGTYVFGAKSTPGSGGGKQGSAFDVATSYKRMDQQPLWPAFLTNAKSSLTVDTKTGAISGTVNLGSNENGRKGTDLDWNTDLNRTMHPGNSTCVIASSYGDVNKASGISSIEDFFDTSIAPGDGSAVFILHNAYKNKSDNDWTFNPLCQPGQYEKFNSFSYNEDGTITLAGTDLCISGYLGEDIPSHEGHVARLKKCLTSEEEKLENMQVWAFSGVFVNAQFGFNEGGKIRLAKDGEAVDLNDKSFFQDLESTNKLTNIKDLESYVNGNSEPDASQHGAGGNINDVTSGIYRMLTVRGWTKDLHGTVLEKDSDSEEIGTSLGSGGPAGNKTDRIVNAETGMCLHNQNGTMVVKNCNVNIGPLYPYCWKYRIATGNKEGDNVGQKTDYCPSGYQIVDPNGSNKYFKNNEPPTDTFKYTEVTSGTSGSISISDGYGNDPFNWGSVTRENGVNNQYTIKNNKGQCLAVIKPGYYYESNRTNRAYEDMNRDFLNYRNYADWISCDTKLYDYYGREVQNAMNWNAPISNGGGSGGGGTDPVEGSSGFQITKEISTDAKWNV